MSSGFVLELIIMRLNPKVVGLVAGAIVSEGSTGVSGRLVCPFSIPAGLEKDGLKEEMVWPDNRAEVVTRLMYLLGGIDARNKADELIQAKKACAAKAEEVISRVGIQGPIDAIEFALDNPFTVGECTYASDRRSEVRSLIETKIRSDEPEKQVETIKRLLHLKAGGYTDDGCIRPGNERPGRGCDHFVKQYVAGVDLAELCAARDCLALFDDDKVERSPMNYVLSATLLIEALPNGPCPRLPGYPKLDFLVGTEKARSLSESSDRAPLSMEAQRDIALRNARSPP